MPTHSIAALEMAYSTCELRLPSNFMPIAGDRWLAHHIGAHNLGDFPLVVSSRIVNGLGSGVQSWSRLTTRSMLRFGLSTCPKLHLRAPVTVTPSQLIVILISEVRTAFCIAHASGIINLQTNG